MKKIYYYSSNFNMSDYYKRTFLVSIAEVFLIALGTALMLYLNSSLPLLLSLLILTVSLTWYIAIEKCFMGNASVTSEQKIAQGNTAEIYRLADMPCHFINLRWRNCICDKIC